MAERFVRAHMVALGLTAVVIGLVGLVVGGIALFGVGHKLDRSCVTRYISASARAQAPRSAANIAQSTALRASVRAEKNLGQDAPKTRTLRGQYLMAAHKYDRIVSNNPIPPLPSCFG